MANNKLAIYIKILGIIPKLNWQLKIPSKKLIVKYDIKNLLPSKEKITNIKSMRIFGNLLHNPDLWHLTRHSVSVAFSIGLFFVWIPIPFHTLLAAGVAILFRANLPISIALVWVNNPITITPLFFFAYKVGAWALSIPPMHYSKMHISIESLLTTVENIWEPFFLGCLICATISSLLSYAIVRIVWQKTPPTRHL
jgi:uncharacterized protein